MMIGQSFAAANGGALTTDCVSVTTEGCCVTATGVPTTTSNGVNPGGAARVKQLDLKQEARGKSSGSRYNAGAAALITSTHAPKTPQLATAVASQGRGNSSAGSCKAAVSMQHLASQSHGSATAGRCHGSATAGSSHGSCKGVVVSKQHLAAPSSAAAPAPPHTGTLAHVTQEGASLRGRCTVQHQQQQQQRWRQQQRQKQKQQQQQQQQHHHQRKQQQQFEQSGLSPHPPATHGHSSVHSGGRGVAHGGGKAVHSVPPALEVCSRLENIQCGDQPVHEYAKEFEKTLSLLKTALPESEVIHQFFKGLPEHIKRVHVVRGEHQWRTYKECKEQVIDTDMNFRAYMTHARAQQPPSAKGPRGGGSRTPAPKGHGSWKRPYQQKGEPSGTQSKKAHAGSAKDPQDADKPSGGCHICGKLGHKAYNCRWRRTVKNSGKPNQGKKPDGSGPSGPKDFQKTN
ncbi:unnamed protein product [Closterium sp. Naga37s-1]|nr:unnamed protein product [Closterium sp. Naga37s-1]